MPYITNQGIKIYYEVEGQGPPLVLVHGITQSLESWRTWGYASALNQDYKLIMVDVRGHGSSDKPDGPDFYDPWTLAADITIILDKLGIKMAHYCGYSMGAWIGLNGAARHFSDRFRSLILGGFSPYPVEQSAQAQVFNNLLGKGTQVFAATLEQISGIRWSAIQADYLQSINPRALIRIHGKMGNLLSEKTLEKIFHDIDIPCLIYAGEDDVVFAGAKKTAGKINSATFIPLPNLNHMTSFTRCDLILPAVRKFLGRN